MKLLRSTITYTALLLLLAGTAGASPPTIAHWMLDEGSGAVVLDTSGSENTGTISGAQWSSETANGTGSALHFDGSDDYVDFGGIDVPGYAMTLSLWFKADSYDVGDGRLISKARRSAESRHYWMLSTSGGDRLRFRLKTDNNTTTLVASDGDLEVGVWTHAAAVYDGATMKIYKDGVEVGSQSKTGSITTRGSVRVAIGNQPPNAGSAPFHGTIDDVRIYDRALDLAEIAALAAGPPVAVSDAYMTERDILLSVDAIAGVLQNDVDPESDPLTAALVSDVVSGTLTLDPDGGFQYQPDPGFVGNDSFTYEATDGGLVSSPATVTLSVLDSDQPVALNDEYSLSQGAVLDQDAAGGVLANDVDPQSDPMVAVLQTDTANGVLALADDGSFVYTPDPGFSGTDSFTYLADEGDSQSNVATVTLTVDPVVQTLRAHWLFDDGFGTTAADSSGLANTGSVFGATWETETPTGTGTALRFDGVDDSVEIGEIELVGDGLTIATWFKASSFAVADARLISKTIGSGESKHHWMLGTASSGGQKLRFRLTAGESTTTLTANAGDLEPEVWTHAAAVYDGATMRLYKDGVLVGSVAKTGALELAGAGVLAAIGNQPVGIPASPFDGLIDDVQLHSRALSAAEILNLVAGSPPDTRIDTPQGTVNIPSGASVVFSATSTTKDLPLTYLWDFDEANSGVPPSTVEDPGALTFGIPGTYTARLTVTNASGISDPIPAEVQILVSASAQVVDNGDMDFSTTGSWHSGTAPSGYAGADFLSADTIGGFETATWVLDVPAAGSYGISGRWVEHTANTNDAPYDIYNNGVLIDSLRVDQRVDGGKYNLFGVYELVPGTVEVVLTNDSFSEVVADAMQISETAFGIVSPRNLDFTTQRDVIVRAEWTGYSPTWSMEFVVDGDEAGAVEISSPPYEVLVSGEGDHTVSVYALDELGVRIVSHTISFAVGDYYVTFGDSITAGTGDDYSADNKSADGRNNSKGYAPILNDLLTAELGYPQNIRTEGVGGQHSFEGLARLPSVLAAHPDAQLLLIQFGTNDIFWVNRDSGLGLSAGDPGYVDSFKDYMHQIVEAVLLDGKLAYLAKPPIMFRNLDGPLVDPSTAPENLLMLDYHVVLDELTAEFGLPTPLPNSYPHFETYPEEMPDLIHPNGTGYQSLAAIWANTLAGVAINLPPEGTIDTPTGSVIVAAGQLVTFAATATDPENDPLTYVWDFDEGSSGVANSTQEDPGALAFDTVGTFQVTFTVTDSFGRADANPPSLSVTVTNDAPNGTIDAPSGPLTVNVGEPVTFLGTATDPDGQLPLSYVWDFDEASSGVAPSVLEDPGAVVFDNVGTYSVSFSVSDGLGLVDPTSAVVDVIVTTAGAPESYIDSPAQNVFVEIDNSLSFSASATDREGDLPATYLWDFDEAGSGVPPSTLQSPSSVAWSTLGTFTVSLTATDSLGQPDPTPATRVVTVIPPNQAPAGVIDTPIGSIAIVAGEAVNFAATGSDPDATFPLSYSWDFEASASGVPSSSLEDPGAVVFGVPGTYSVTLTVSDAALLEDPNPPQLTVLVSTPAMLVDNLDAEFASAGEWFSGTNPQEYIGSNYLASDKGSGADTATWSFTVPAAGAYGISAQWIADSGNATDAPYIIYNNGVDLGTVRVDQTRSGGALNLLDVFDLSAGTLDVVVSDAANGWVMADAVEVSETAFGISEPMAGSLITTPDVSVAMQTLGLPAQWGVEFVIDGESASAVQSYTPPFSAVLVGQSVADHTVEAYAIDANGGRVAGLAASAQFSIGSYFVAFGGTISNGFGDNVSSDNTSQDGRNSHKGYASILNDMLTASQGHAHTIETEGVNLSLAADEVARIDGVLAAHPSAQAILILVGMTDAFDAATPSGMGLSDADAGYAGSYKDSMAQIATAVLDTGREPLLSKLSMCVGDYSGTPFADPQTAPLNLLIQEYNQAIDEVAFDLVLNPGPDLYDHFSTFPGELSDDCHPNGSGYNSIAALWQQALTGIPINLAPNGTIDSPATSLVVAGGEAVLFEGSVSDPDGDPLLSVVWDFDEANSGVAPSTLEDPGLIAFGAVGTFTVTFTVTDSLGRADGSPATTTITVTNDAPESVIDAPAASLTVNTGEPLTFLGTGSDPDAQVPLLYTWDFDGANSGVSPSTLEDPGAITFAAVGTFTVTLTVSDGLGLADPTPASVVVTVTQAGAPETFIDSPAADVWVEIDSAVNFSGTATDREGDLPATFLWDFDEASSGVAASTLEDPGAVVFGTLGTFIVTLTASDSLGQPDPTPAMRTVTVIPTNQAPDAAIDSPAGSIVIAAGEPLVFEASANDPDATFPLSYVWDFGAGSGVAASSLEDPGSVIFPTPGTYTVTLTVSDAALLADPTPAEVTVLVQPAPMLVDNEDPEFTSVGEWFSGTNPAEYIGSDYLASNSGSGADTATWSFTVASAGSYGISAQWIAGDNAPDAPYTLYNNGVVLGTAYVDQRLAGGTLNHLGVYDLEVGTLDVVLTDDASGWVMADAVQVSETAFGISTPVNGSLTTARNISVSMETLGLPVQWGVEFVVDGDVAGAMQSYTPPFNVVLSGLSLDSHTLEAYAIDAEGIRVSGISALTEFSMGDYFVAFGGSITNGYGDNVSSDNESLDGRNDHKGYAPILNDLLTASEGYAHAIETEGVNLRLAADEASRVPSVLAAHPESQAVLILVGMTDAFDEQTASGLGLSFGDPGYAGSYKDSMFEISAAVLDGGREPLIGKLIMCVGDYSGTPFPDPATAPLNLLIQDYNQAIDEVAAELLLIPGPDLYSHFEANPGELGDDCHPNGAGYQSIAALWQQTLSGAPINLAPDAIIDSPVAAISIAVGESVLFESTASDPEGDPLLTYLWDFDEASSGVAPSTQEDPGTLLFDQVGSFDVTLTVTDSLGRSDSTPATVGVTVSNDAPESAIDSPSSSVVVNVGEPVTFLGTASDPDGQTPLSYAWDFDQASSGVAPSTLEDPGAIVFGTVGTFVVTFAATDAYGVTDATPASRVVTVTLVGAPESQIDTPAGNISVESGSSVSFSGSATDREGDLPATFLWDFDEASSGVPSSTLEDPGSVVFPTIGTFVVTLTASDSLGQADPTPASVIVTVTPGNQAPDSAIESPAGGAVVVAGQAVSFAGSGSDIDGTFPLSYVWDFDEGASGVASSTLEDPGSIVFPTAGTYTVSLTVSDAELLADQTPASVTIQVLEAPVIIDNLDQGFAAVGTWFSGWNPSGFYGFNYLAGDPGDGSDTATWSFAIASSGSYGISAQWITASWAPTDAPYTIYNNGTELATVRVNQQADGGVMNLLGVFSLSAGTLEVVLSDDANGWPVADAVQLSKTAFGFVSPAPGSLSFSQDVTVDVEALGLHPDWGVELVPDGDIASAVQIATAPFTGVLYGLSVADHTVEAYAIDASGARVEGVFASVGFSIGDYYVAYGDARVQGFGDNIGSDNTSADGRNDSKGFPPILNDLLTADLGYAQTVENEGQAGVSFDSGDGAQDIGNLLAAHPSALTVLILFGPDDAVFSQTPSGVGLSPGDAGYGGSYKHNITQIVEAVIADGKEAVLGKSALCLGDYSGSPFADPATAPVNVRFQEYNQAIDEIVADVGLTVTPPDFYTYFEQNPGEFRDDCYPNGVGYQSMAELWRAALTAP